MTEIHERDRLEGMLSGDVRSYLRVCEKRRREVHVSTMSARERNAVEKNDVEIDDVAEQDGLRSVCSTLARLLGELLEGREDWNRYNWIDAILPISTTVLSSSELKVEGLMIWGKNRQSSEWIEPFSASARISDAKDGWLSYEIKCGESIRGLGKMPYSMSPKRARWSAAQEWLFTFSRDGDREVTDLGILEVERTVHDIAAEKFRSKG